MSMWILVFWLSGVAPSDLVFVHTYELYSECHEARQEVVDRNGEVHGPLIVAMTECLPNTMASIRTIADGTAAKTWTRQ